MITQEEIPYTLEEYKAMVKTIAQLRKEKKELIDKACKWLEELFTESDENPYVVTYQFDSIQEMIEDLRKAMEE